MIELNGLAKSFSGKPALTDINLFIQENEIFGIIGKSGAGKSTLLRSINLLERPDAGEDIDRWGKSHDPSPQRLK